MDRDPLSGYVGERSYSFPLYRYEFNHLISKMDKMLNVSSKIIEMLRKKYYNDDKEMEKSNIAKDLIYYIYAVLNDSKYRNEYSDLLEFDFPRIPFYSKNIYESYKELGKELVDLHLENKEIEIIISIEGSNLIVDGQKVEWNEEKKGISINEETTLLNISKKSWDYEIGRYKILDKFLKARDERDLSLTTLEHIYKVSKILDQSITIIKKIENIELNE